jgi:uncharacterized protein (DUF3084 family)
MSNNSNTKVHALYIALILLLMVGLVLTNLKLKKSKEVIEVTKVELDNSQDLYSELEAEYKKAMDDLDLFREEKVGLENVLSERERELEMKKKQIGELIKSGKNSQADLERARQMIRDLNKERLVFIGKIDSLTRVAATLTMEKETLIVEKTELSGELENVRTEKEQVKDENQKLKSTVDKAKILSTTNIKVIPMKGGRKGKEVEVKRAKDAETLKVCFDLLPNRVAPSGETEIVVRIVGPDGVTIQLDALGSGTLTEATTGNRIPYTYVIRPDYQNESKTVCSLWSQSFSFAPGNYSVEIYQKGLLIGQTNFSLK